MSGRDARARRRRGRRPGACGAAVAALLAICLIAVPVTGAQPPAGVVHQPGGSEQELLRLGAGLFAANCASCHGSLGEGVREPSPKGAEGITGQGPPLRGVGELAPDFYLRTGRMPIEHAGEEPERQAPQFNDHEIRALVAYVASFGGGPKIPHPHPATNHLTEGMTLFTEHCAGCHQIVGQGGFVTGAKVPVLQHATATQIAEAVRIGPYVMPRFSPKAISGPELNRIVAYVLKSQEPDDAGGLGIGHIGPVPEGMVAWFVAAIVLVGICVIIGERRKA
jgi:ubiquinol-cytochrome c reductase cytochrome c subunit